MNIHYSLDFFVYIYIVGSSASPVGYKSHRYEILGLSSEPNHLCGSVLSWKHAFLLEQSSEMTALDVLSSLQPILLFWKLSMLLCSRRTMGQIFVVSS